MPLILPLEKKAIHNILHRKKNMRSPSPFDPLFRVRQTQAQASREFKKNILRLDVLVVSLVRVPKQDVEIVVVVDECWSGDSENVGNDDVGNDDVHKDDDSNDDDGNEDDGNECWWCQVEG